ncbi:LapA family protein [Mycobacterium sp.]|uniref:LapA family protein n=1 Tax=Mycobacterium sp. TaxID=1785 RepID=UPI003BAB398D
MSSKPTGSTHQPSGATPPPARVPGSTSKAPAVTFTRAGALWSAVIIGFLILMVLLIFIAQNTESTPFTFFGWHWSLPLGVAILLAAVGGGLVTVFAATARILQLRRAAKKS